MVKTTTKIKNFTGFEPKISLKEGLTKTVEWFKDPSTLDKYKSELYKV